MTPLLKRAWFRAAVVLLAAGFVSPLLALWRFAAGSQLYSHLPLIPLLSLYLAWMRRRTRPPAEPGDARLVLLFLTLALASWTGGEFLRFRGGDPTSVLAAGALSFVAFVAAGVSAFSGRARLRHAGAPLAFLVLLAPLPAPWLAAAESFLQSASALGAVGLFRLAGTPVLASGSLLQLPGLWLQVAPECSGIHSTLVLLVTSLFVGCQLYARAWPRVLLAACVIPIGLLRNSVRIFAIGELCLRFGPQMIDSPLHRQGGPLFFVLSLFPLLGCAFWLARHEPVAPARLSRCVPSSLS
ncbi:MAG TPA: exosortase/archaeosortase family protein [Opitutus sp.]|nr:exosortase/archaeosortase family protein [Opitutus sp.]